MDKTKTMTIDLTPTWMTVLSWVEDGLVPASELRNAVQLADFVMAAQKEGAKSCTFTFEEDGSVTFDDGLPELDNQTPS